MRRLRGKNRDVRLVPRDYCNDWIMVDTADGAPAGIVSPAGVRLDPDDVAFFAARDPDHPQHGSHGSFWREWRLRDDGRFERLSPPPRRTQRSV